MPKPVNLGLFTRPSVLILYKTERGLLKKDKKMFLNLCGAILLGIITAVGLIDIYRIGLGII